MGQILVQIVHWNEMFALSVGAAANGPARFRGVEAFTSDEVTADTGTSRAGIIVVKQNHNRFAGALDRTHVGVNWTRFIESGDSKPTPDLRAGDEIQWFRSSRQGGRTMIDL
jgi:hypothetical protein